MNPTIAIITCYFGDFPWYFQYFLHSCKFNPTIDFIIVTDNENGTLNKPENVKIVNKSLEEIKIAASEKLGFRVNIDYPYKLCDFKPAYGFLFSELIKQYDFWGHGDIDVVYGNIRKFMTKKLLGRYDIISSRHDYITGTFCLFRNKPFINSLFTESNDYKNIFSSAQHFCFDECAFLWKELESGASIFDFPHHVQSMTYLVKKAENEGRIKAFFDFIIVEGAPGKIKWDRGKIIYRNEYEAMFYHLIKFKTVCTTPVILNPVPDVFYFTTKKIIVKKNGLPRL